MQDAIKKKESGQQSRSFSTYTSRASRTASSGSSRLFSTSAVQRSDSYRDVQRAAEQSLVESSNRLYDEHEDDEFDYEADEDELEGVPALGHKFALPEMPLPPGSNMKKRYDTLVDQVTKLLMRDGKLSVAQRVC